MGYETTTCLSDDWVMFLHKIENTVLRDATLYRLACGFAGGEGCFIFNKYYSSYQ
jgi:hypothetical protein